MGLFVHFVDIEKRRKEKKHRPIYRVAAQLKTLYFALVFEFAVYKSYIKYDKSNSLESREDALRMKLTTKTQF